MSQPADQYSIDLPWPETDIAWRYTDKEDRHRAIKEQIVAGQDFIVREVMVRPRNIKDRDSFSVSEIEDVLAYTNEEFDLLRGCGIEVAQTDWHVFTDESGVNRALARVGVVDGEMLGFSWDDDNVLDQWNDWSDKVCQYLAVPPGGDRLVDIYPSWQYIVGTFRSPKLVDRTPSPKPILIDTEPIYWL